MDKNKLHNAPRLRAYLDARKHIFMEKRTWEEIKSRSPEPQSIKLEETPLKGIENNSDFLGAQARLLNPIDYEIKVYRYDKKDSKPINVDGYLVSEDINFHLDLPKLAIECSTCIDTNMNFFVKEHVMFVPKEHDDHHWLDIIECPIEIQAAAIKKSNEE